MKLYNKQKQKSVIVIYVCWVEFDTFSVYVRGVASRMCIK